MVVHLASATHHIADARNVRAIAGTAWHRILLEHVDVVAGHLRVTHQIAGGGQRCKTRADDVGVLIVDSLGLPWPGERFVIAVGIIHDFLLWTSLGTIVPRRGTQVYGHELDAMSNFVDVGGISLIGGGFRLCAKVILPICGRFSLQKDVRGRDFYPLMMFWPRSSATYKRYGWLPNGNHPYRQGKCKKR